MKILCKIIAGSKLYGLETVDSDTDIRGVFLNTDYRNILGLSKNEIIKEQVQEDSLFFEFLHFIKSLRKTNTQVIEILFSEVFEQSSDEFEQLRKNKFKLIDSRRIYSSLLGYIHNEKRLAVGERTGHLGSKRKTQLEKYGFSPKNFCHLLRLAYCGKVFFEESTYPVNLGKHDKIFRNFLFSVKTEPEKFTKEELIKFCDEAVIELHSAFENRKDNFTFDLDLANRFCLKFYYPFLRSSHDRLV